MREGKIMLTVEKISDVESFAALRDEWETLLAQCPHGTPFLTHDWMMTWWKHFGIGKELCILVVRENGRAVAIAPLMKYRGQFYERYVKIPMRVIETMANYHSNRVDLIFAQFRYDVLVALWGFLLNQKGWDCLRLYPIPADSLTVVGLRRLAIHQGLRAAFLPDQSSPYLVIDRPWDEYIRQLPSHLRRKLRKAERLTADRLLKAEIITQDTDLEARLSAMFAVAEKGWAGRQGTAISSTQQLRGFYTDLARIAHQRGWLWLGLLKAGEQAIAYEYNLRYGQTGYNLKLGFDPAYAHYNPGTVLRSAILSDTFQNGHRLREFDFLGGAERYKLEWTRQVRPHLKIYLYHPRSLYGRFLHLIQSHLLLPLHQWRRHRSVVSV